MAACKVTIVPGDSCYISFTDGTLPKERRSNHTQQLNDTVRGETVIADLDEHGRIIGIELVGHTKETAKPCQEITRLTRYLDDGQ